MDGWKPLFNSPGLWLVPVMFFFALVTAFEFGQLVSKHVAISPWSGTSLTCLVLLITSIPIFYRAVTQKPYPEACPIGILGWIGLGLLLACGIAALIMLRSYSLGQSQTLERWALLTLITVYVAGFCSLWIAIRLFGEPTRSLLNLVGIIAVAKITDAAAYFTGRFLGKHKLCPSISPGKTIEGAVGGLASGIVASIIYFQFCVPTWTPASEGSHTIAWWGPLVFGVLISLVAMIGDLIESVVKRTVGVKDSGQLLPGMGGIWDVTDSLLPTAAIGYVGLIAKWI